MTEAEFHRQIDTLFNTLEQRLDHYDDLIDFDQTGGVLSLSFSNGSKLIFSRQTPLRQLWLAARSGGFHFVWRDEQWWRDSDQENLSVLLNRVASEQAGCAITLLERL